MVSLYIGDKAIVYQEHIRIMQIRMRNWLVYYWSDAKRHQNI